MDIYTLIFFKWITNKDILYNTWNSAQRHVAAWMGGVFGGEWIRILCMAESRGYSPEIITTFFIDYTAIQNKKLKRNRLSLKKLTSGYVVCHLNYFILGFLLLVYFLVFKMCTDSHSPDTPFPFLVLHIYTNSLFYSAIIAKN